MSQDLFAAFGEEDTGAVWGDQNRTQERPSASNNDFFNVWTEEQTTSFDQAKDAGILSAVDDDDDFGDFEDAAATQALDGGINRADAEPKPKSTQTVIASKSSQDKAATKKGKDTNLLQASSKQQVVGHHPFAGRMDLLFEAGDDEYDAGSDELADLATNPEAAMAYSKRIIAEQEAAQLRRENASFSREQPVVTAVAEAKRGQAQSSYGQTESVRSPARDPNVLFDADDLSEEEAGEDEDDDFDDFENGEESFEPVQRSIDATDDKQASNTSAMELLGFGDSWQPAASAQSNSDPLNGEPASAGVAQERSITAPASTMHFSSKEEDEFWEDFETSATSEAPSSSKMEIPPLPSSKSKTQSRQAPTNNQNLLPPTNVPPPAVLLSIFPYVFAEADEALFNTIAKLDLKQKQMLLTHPASHQFLKRYLGHCTALARIIAGRKQRWKRDQRLSQSMRIGPAAAGGKGGMKLTGLDKSEVAKEDREVLDVLRLWKAQVGKLRTAVAAASAAPAVPKLPSVPEITDQISVKTLKPAEGGMTAPQPCALCGLKREERVAKVDVEVDDSFGEWWVQGMNMHLSCRSFWDEFERKLKSR